MSVAWNRNLVHLTRAMEHLRTAIPYSVRGRGVFFDPVVPDTFLVVEGELRKAFQSLDGLGLAFYSLNPGLDSERITEIRQLRSHDSDDIRPDALWNVVV